MNDLLAYVILWLCSALLSAVSLFFYKKESYKIAAIISAIPVVSSAILLLVLLRDFSLPLSDGSRAITWVMRCFMLGDDFYELQSSIRTAIFSSSVLIVSTVLFFGFMLISIYRKRLIVKNSV